MFMDGECVFHLCGSHHYTETILAMWQQDSILCKCLQGHYSILKEKWNKLAGNVSPNSQALQTSLFCEVILFHTSVYLMGHQL
jgi:hypothetical protein